MDITEPFVHRLTAYVLGMECYKNNALISEKHRSGTPTDIVFYNDVLRQVTSSLDKQITDINALQKQGGIWDVLAKGNTKDNAFYESYLRYYEECLKGKRWDPPVKLDDRTDLPPAEYVLGGAFRQHCEESLPLTQEAMNIINHDVHNRIFTLVEQGKIPLPLKR